MVRLVRQSIKSPIVRETALRIVGRFPDYGIAVRRILQFVRSEMIHIDEGVEMLHRPEWVLGQLAEGQRVWGDCDDEATLIASLLFAIGIPSRFVAVRREDRNFFEHVFTEALVSRSWQMLDPRYERIPGGTWIRMVQEI